MTQNTRRCRWCKELYRGKCGCDAETMLENMAEALELVRAHGLNAVDMPSGESVSDTIDKVLKEYLESVKPAG